MAWGKAGSTTTTSSANSMDSGTMIASETNQILCHVSGLSASTFCETLFNSDTGSNYANRGNQNGGTDFTRTSQSDLNMFESYGNTTGAFLVSYFVNISGEEKLGISQSIREGTSGAGNAPERDEVVYKWTNTSSEITSSTFTPQSGTIDTGSNLTVLGSDLTPQINSPAVPAVPALMPSLQSPSVGGWKELGRKKLGSAGDSIDVSNISNKKYLMFIVQAIPSGDTNLGLRFNGETGSRYSQNGSFNTANDSSGSATSTSCVGNYGSAITTPALHIGYVVNETNKIKLIRSNSIIQKGTSDAPDIQESWGTFAPSTITEVIEDLSWINSDTGSFDSDSELIVLGWDPADTHTDNFWEELATITETEGTSETFNTPVFTSKKYIMFEAYIIDQNNSDAGIDMYVNDTTGSGTYRMRYDNNYAKAGYDGGTGNGSRQLLYGNGFVNNENYYMRGFCLNVSGKQKLFMADGVTDGGSNTGTPNARVLGGKTVATSYDITQIGFRNRGTTTGKDIGIGSVIKVWGSD